MANFELCSKWYHRCSCQEFKELISVMKKGDVVQVKNRDSTCSEWAICVTDGPNPTVAYGFCDVSLKKKGAQQELVGLKTFGRGSRIRINNSRDKLSKPERVEEILKDLETAAHRFGGTSVRFRPQSWNGCHDFVKMVRYGTGSTKDRLDDDRCSQWFEEEDVETFLWLLQAGDLVEFNEKDTYSHWAVCSGNPRHESPKLMVHRCGSETASELKSDLAGTVIQSPFGQVARGCRFRVNNSWELKYEPEHAVPNYPLYSHRYTRGPYDPKSNNSWHYVMRLSFRMNERGNLALRTQWYSSAEELRVLLTAGDVIEVRRTGEDGMKHRDWAVYVGDGQGWTMPGVAYRCYSGEPPGTAAVRAKSPAELSKDGEVCIDDETDDGCRPRKSKDVAEAAAQADGQEDLCQSQEDLSIGCLTPDELYHWTSRHPRRNETVCFPRFWRDAEVCTIEYKRDDSCQLRKQEGIAEAAVQADGREDSCQSQEDLPVGDGHGCPTPDAAYRSTSRHARRKVTACFPEFLRDDEGYIFEYDGDDDCQLGKQEDIVEVAVRADGQDVPLIGCPTPDAAHRWTSRRPLGKAVVRTASLEEFLKDGEFCIENRWGDCFQPRKAEDVVREVLRAVGREEDSCPCDRISGVCPHFALGVRYGKEARTVLQEAFSCWWKRTNLVEVQTELLRLGDIVEAKEGWVSHFAIYVGNGRVAHRCRRGSCFRSGTTMSTLADFVAERQCRVNNFWDCKLPAKKPEDVVQQALDVREVIRSFRIYNLTGNDCFDFVCQTRYELVLSDDEITKDTGSCDPW